MAQNSLYPGFLKIKYVSAFGDHFKILPIFAYSEAIPGEEPSISGVDRAPALMSTLVDEYVAIARSFWTNTVNIVYAEAWSMASAEADPIFVYSYEIGVLGDDPGTTTNMMQVVMTYRTALGGLFKEYFMDTCNNWAVNIKDPYPYAAATVEKEISDYLKSSSGSWIVGRDGGRVISPINLTTKTNDALRKDRVLNQ